MLDKAYHFRPCPHCGELMRAGTLVRHEPACIKNPVMYARIREALFSGNGTTGVTYSRYLKLSADDKSLPSTNTLIRQSKSAQWGGVLAFFRLSVPPQDERQMSRQPNRSAANRAKRKPKPQPAPVALAVAPVVESVTVPLPRIKPIAPPPASKWAGLKGYDPTWKAPTGDTQWLVRVHPGERTCLACGDTFAAGSYCMRCGTRADGTRLSKDAMPPSVPTEAYLHPDEYVTVR